MHFVEKNHFKLLLNNLLIKIYIIRIGNQLIYITALVRIFQVASIPLSLYPCKNF